MSDFTSFKAWQYLCLTKSSSNHKFTKQAGSFISCALQTQLFYTVVSTFVPFFLKSLREACMFDANSSGIFLHRGIPKKETRVCNNTVLPEVCLQKEHPKPFYTTSLKALLSKPKTLLQACEVLTVRCWSRCTKQIYLWDKRQIVLQHVFLVQRQVKPLKYIWIKGFADFSVKLCS